MKKIKIVTMVVLLATSYRSTGQTTIQPIEKPYIEVTGTAELEIAPDEIIVDIIITERYDGRDKITVELQEENLKKALTEIGVDHKALSLSAANAEYVRVKWKSKDVLTSKYYKVKLSEADKVARLFEQLDKLDIDRAYVSMMNHSKIDSLKKETRIKAIKAAKEKADYLLNAIGSNTGKPLMVQESEKDPANVYALNALNSRFKAQAGNELFVEDDSLKKGSGTQLRMIKVQSGITVRFLIQ